MFRLKKNHLPSCRPLKKKNLPSCRLLFFFSYSAMAMAMDRMSFPSLAPESDNGMESHQSQSCAPADARRDSRPAHLSATHARVRLQILGPVRRPILRRPSSEEEEEVEERRRNLQWCRCMATAPSRVRCFPAAASPSPCPRRRSVPARPRCLR